MDDKERFISGQDLFPVIEEQLISGNRVSFTVSGSSMMPWIVNNRDQVELISVKNLVLKKGDIILFLPFPGKYVLHRITKIVPGGYITTGDGNLHRDGFISTESVIGKVVKIHRKGKLIDCDNLHWRIIFSLWMKLFPIRKWLFILLNHFHKYIRN